MAQPSLSEQVRRLEAELGVALFARVGRGLELTEAGRLFRPHAERTAASAQEAAESVREVRDMTGGTVAFGTFGSAHHYLLAGLLQDFRTQFPNVRVRAIGLIGLITLTLTTGTGVHAQGTPSGPLRIGIIGTGLRSALGCASASTRRRPPRFAWRGARSIDCTHAIGACSRAASRRSWR